MAEKDFFTCSVENGVALITIDRPPLNVLGFEYYKELCLTVLELAESRKARAVVITGTKKSFIAGMDIKDINAITTPQQNDAKTLEVKALFRKMEKLKIPVIAGVDGNCFGGGLELAAACHIRIVSKEAKLGVPEINVGTIPTFGGTQRLPRIIGKARALELMLTGKFISGDEAFRIGLANEVCPSDELVARATSLATEIAGKSPDALQAVMQAVTEGLEMEIDLGIELESHVSSALVGTYNMKEGMAAFFERRKPVFNYE
jgi:enoyl-CoA hydratase